MRLTNLAVAILALASLVGCSRTADVPAAQSAPALVAVETSAPAPAPPESPASRIRAYAHVRHAGRYRRTR